MIYIKTEMKEMPKGCRDCKEHRYTKTGVVCLLQNRKILLELSGKYKSKANGFVLGGLCKLNNECKMQPIRLYLKRIKEPYTQIVGICIDEPIRIARLKGNTISLLAQYNYTQQDALYLCKKYNLLSPIYALRKNRRSGCWNCPNQSIESFATLKQVYPHLWNRLKEMSKTENLCAQGFKWGKTFAQVEREVDNIIYFRENQISMFKE